MKNALKITLLAFIAGFAGSFFFYQYFIKPDLNHLQGNKSITEVRYDGQSSGSSASAPTRTFTLPVVDFSDAAAKATQSVVYINSISQGVSYTYWDWFFGDGGSNSRTQVSRDRKSVV